MLIFKIFWIFLTIGLCDSLCSIVSSFKHGQLSLSKSGKARPGCVSDLVFENQKTEQNFCLSKERKVSEKLECATCKCGQENRPDEQGGRYEVGVGVVGGEEVGEHQYPWYAAIFWKNKFIKKHMACGGSLITEKLVLSAGHCENMNVSETFIALGLHNVSGFKTWSEQELSKHVIRSVTEIIKHPQYNDQPDIRILFFDFALFILETPVKISKVVSPVCLPLPNEFDTLEKEKNILIGFGLSRMWFQSYNELLGGELQHAPLIPAEILFNKTLLSDKLDQPNFQKNIIDGYFKTFKEIFPGIEACIDDNNDFVRHCHDGAKNEEIVMKIANKISNTGRDMDEEVVKNFLETTRNEILPQYSFLSFQWEELTALSLREKIAKGYFGYPLQFYSEAHRKKILKSIKFVNQWLFIGKQAFFVAGLTRHPILKRAKGDFLPMTDEDKRTNPSTIVVQRSGMNDGFACKGDSGGPIVVKRSGRFVLAGIVSTVPIDGLVSYWPPSCWCNCEGEGENHARVSAALPWIDQVMKKRNFSLSCQ